MDGYRVVFDAMEAASKTASRAAVGVRPVDLGGTLAGVSAGLAGGTAIEAARLLGEMWTRELPVWVKNMQERSGQLASAVSRYRANEQEAAADPRVAAVHSGPRPI
ncbi:hypothetical protein [Amycolatopsis sp. NPDC059657]|uniref:hypothetical protein n=1 Tax=Amycolatopsis sp. NPDC059657 TaxID=3346899 RepID=UPI0036704AB2